MSQSKRLAGKSAVVIGAGSVGPGWGNGKAAAVLFAREGARVLCVDIDSRAVRETVDIIRAEGGEAELEVADATSPSDVRRLIDAAIGHFGVIDILHNNVGTAQVGGVVDLPLDDWRRLLDLNLTTCFLAMKEVIPHMESEGGGAITNVSSVASVRYTGVPYAGYYAPKAAMNHLTRTTAAEFAAKKIRVNAILPGMMKTPMVAQTAGLTGAYGAEGVEEMWAARAKQCPTGEMGDAWDVAYAALYLASDEAKYVTGIELVVDGGLTLQYA